MTDRDQEKLKQLEFERLCFEEQLRHRAFEMMLQLAMLCLDTASKSGMTDPSAVQKNFGWLCGLACIKREYFQSFEKTWQRRGLPYLKLIIERWGIHDKILLRPLNRSEELRTATRAMTDEGLMVDFDEFLTHDAEE